MRSLVDIRGRKNIRGEINAAVCASPTPREPDKFPLRHPLISKADKAPAFARHGLSDKAVTVKQARIFFVRDELRHQGNGKYRETIHGTALRLFKSPTRAPGQHVRSRSPLVRLAGYPGRARPRRPQGAGAGGYGHARNYTFEIISWPHIHIPDQENTRQRQTEFVAGRG